MTRHPRVLSVLSNQPEKNHFNNWAYRMSKHFSTISKSLPFSFYFNKISSSPNLLPREVTEIEYSPPTTNWLFLSSWNSGSFQIATHLKQKAFLSGKALFNSSAKANENWSRFLNLFLLTKTCNSGTFSSCYFFQSSLIPCLSFSWHSCLQQ